MQKNYAIGIDLGGTHMRVALVSREGTVIEKVKEPVSEDLIGSLLKAIAGLFSDEVAGIGIGVAGLIGKHNRRVLLSPNLHAVEKIDLIGEMSKEFPVPVNVENDASAAAFGEMWAGAGRTVSSFVLFTLGTGIGGGIVYERKLLNVAAEIRTYKHKR